MISSTKDETVLRSGRGLGVELYRGERMVLATHQTWERIALLITTLLLAVCYYAWPEGHRVGQPGGVVTASTMELSMPAAAVTDDEAESEREAAVPAETRILWKPKDRQYVERFYRTAIAEMDQYGIPASITMAQGLLESGAGQSTLATNGNNHFGIKCFSKTCRPGHCSNHSDDHHKDFFQNFPSAWHSYRAHSEFLAGKSRYAGLFSIPDNDYREWAKGLSRAGYATDPRYASKLIGIIDKYQLHLLDDPDTRSHFAELLAFAE